MEPTMPHALVDVPLPDGALIRLPLLETLEKTDAYATEAAKNPDGGNFDRLRKVAALVKTTIPNAPALTMDQADWLCTFLAGEYLRRKKERDGYIAALQKSPSSTD